VGTQGGAESVRPRGVCADLQPKWHCHRHFILTADGFRRSLIFFVLHPKMNARHLTFASLLLLGIPCSDAQNPPTAATPDPVQAAIRQFNEHRASKPNEVTVVLDPVGVPPAAIPKDPHSGTVVTPPDTRSAPDTAPPRSEPDPDQPATPPLQPAGPAPAPRQGLAVRVEKLQAGTGTIDPAQVKLLAPFPAKPLSPAPAGWSLQSSTTAPPFTRVVELTPGNTITLTVHPHVLVPAADGATVFNVSEPGFDATLGYHQTATVGAILAHSVRLLEDDSKDLGTAIDQLQQILVSLPKPPPAPEPVAEPAPALKPAPARKR